MARSDGLSLGYRIGWRVRYALTSVFGPAQLGTADDPQQKLRCERERRVEQARRERGTTD
ncbi:hypothetical protein [Phycicoccus avicenniae]|uniref:hypothetical protein n=1 Tax=Phycicoccus avicenniae TaxID=2828860 RepID=UPI003D2C1379